MWNDAFLQWDPETTGVYRIVVAAKRVWLPEIAPENRYELEFFFENKILNFRSDISMSYS